jgi:hypothetical protein
MCILRSIDAFTSDADKSPPRHLERHGGRPGVDGSFSQAASGIRVRVIGQIDRYFIKLKKESVI